MENRIFYYALISSLVIHLSLISYFSITKTKLFRKPLKKIEVTYQALKFVQKKTKQTVSKTLKIQEQIRLKERPEKPLRNLELNSSLAKIKDISKLTKKIKLGKREIPKIKMLDLDRKITIPLLKSEKITNPQYLSYNQVIRHKIKQRAYSYIDHLDFNSGEVYLTFIVRADGFLQGTQIVPEKTTASDYIKKIGLRSIIDSDPFPPFPKDLTYPELTFNVVISFQIDD